MTFHEWLREKLISRNYTQDEFGKAVGVTGQAVNHWVNGNIIFCGKDLKTPIEKIEEELRKITDEPEKPLHENHSEPF